MTYQIRPITEQDIFAFRAAVDLVARERRYLRRLEGPSLESVTNFVRGNISKSNPHLVVTSNGQLAGWCDIVRHDGSCEQHIGTMGMGLLPEWRGQGIGRRLLAAALEAAATAQLTRVELSVHSSNARAIGLYRSSGFLHEGLQSRARYIEGRFEDVLLMARLDASIAP